MKPGDKIIFIDKFGNKNLKGIFLKDNQDGTATVEETGIGLKHGQVKMENIRKIGNNS